ncbi:polyphosphate:AMP phosphotransferase [Opitutaceae bacterium TAV5]|nr:polyphosphate:AMP phosphotransferase [Opitutaceae bacterium TAV5]
MKKSLLPASRKSVTIDLGNDKDIKVKLKHVIVPPGKKIRLGKDYDPRFTGGFRDKEAAIERVQENTTLLSELQDKLYAQNTWAVLILFQGLDAAGKDGVIKHVMSGVNPQGCNVTGFKVPSSGELAHDYLWRCVLELPRRGMIGIFNRSWYEEVLVARVHPGVLDRQNIPEHFKGKGIWKRRFEQINNFEKYLTENGVVVLKFFLNVSKKEQGRRFAERIARPEKNWKFSSSDYAERQHWDDYQAAYEDCLNHTSTPWAPWFVVPADNKWFTRFSVSETIVRVLKRLSLRYPDVSEEQRQKLAAIGKQLEKELPKAKAKTKPKSKVGTKAKPRAKG